MLYKDAKGKHINDVTNELLNKHFILLVFVLVFKLKYSVASAERHTVLQAICARC